ncbi:MAG: insulinase family protein [Bacteroidetes bacterium]|nr:insulinase family protein [Bacteroidota bacterium]
MLQSRLSFLFALLLVLPNYALAQEETAMPSALPDIPYEKFVLDNGLTLLVHEDNKAPIVAVNIWYHVGSKNEPAGRSGFAHLFEHLMFNGSENFDDDYFQVLERTGATDLNGTTNEDRTNYFQNVPTNALDLALWMESDRMGHLVGAISQEKLDEQRGVVQNEKRQGENEPFGQVDNRITAATWPAGHPYSHTVIGSMEDLNAASLDDVKEWFKTYYGPNNAVIAVAGNIDPETAKAKVEKFFGDIPPGPPIAHFETWIAKRTGTAREVMQDRVPQARIYKVWNVPEVNSTENNLLDLVSDILSSGKSSRFYKRLVYQDQIATDVNAYLDSREIASQFVIRATAKPGVDLADVEKAIDEELARLIASGPTAAELARVRTQNKANFIRGIERIGGFGGKSDILASGEVFSGSPETYRKRFADQESASASDISDVARKWLTDGVYILEVHPFPQLSSAEDGADRTKLPAVAAPPEAVFPSLQRSELSNGMKVVLAERHAIPTVDFSLMIDAGYAADQSGIPGTASLAMNMLDEGTANRSSLEISDALSMLGAGLGTGSDLDESYVTLSALKENLAPSLDLYADVILNPSFPQAEVDRLKQEQLARIQREKVTPVQMAVRVFPELLYGSGHAYSIPLTGSGTEESVSGLTRADLKSFHDTWFKPNNATLVVVGDITMSELKPILERRFGAWKKGSTPKKNISQVAQKDKSVVYLLDRPGSQQSIIFAGHLAPPKSASNDLAIETMNTILGGAFTSRINMNLREDKGWSYGAFSLLFDARGQRPFLVYAPVQTDKTSESMAEILAELKRITTTNPITDDEVDKAKENLTLSLAGQWETNNAVEGSIAEIVRFDLKDDYFQTYTRQIRSLNKKEISDAADSMLKPDRLVWIVVGDRSVIEPGIKELGYGEIHVIDGDGNMVKDGTN